eukprot:gb/GEZN01017923.1/.p1 GENE.gb/GEZN01017923.1/~~gb/GEZN01017923.1/.p1  ORF type:complete len:121 (+),score=37.52 gb/GEZN01017923.1/:387-749(+)
MLAARRGQRKPLAKQEQPFTIRSLEPSFHDNFRPDKDYDPIKQRAEMKKLRQQVHKERKGALRELRKDASFLALQSQQQKQAEEKRREKKRKEILTDLQLQARDSNIFAAVARKKKKFMK